MEGKKEFNIDVVNMVNGQHSDEGTKKSGKRLEKTDNSNDVNKKKAENLEGNEKFEAEKEETKNKISEKIFEEIGNLNIKMEKLSENFEQIQNKSKENEEVKAKKEKTKNEISEKIFEEMKKLNDMFLEKIHSIQFEKEAGDKLHKELEQYKNDLYFKLIKPIIMDLIEMREDFKHEILMISETADEFNKEVLEFLESYVEKIEIILERNDVEIYKTDILENQKVDVKKQKIFKKIPTDDESKHGLISKKITDGYTYKEKVILPEKVEVYIYKKESKGE